MEWTFYRETMVQYQLDNALLNYTASSARPFHDAVGSTDRPPHAG